MFFELFLKFEFRTEIHARRSRLVAKVLPYWWENELPPPARAQSINGREPATKQNCKLSWFSNRTDNDKLSEKTAVRIN